MGQAVVNIYRVQWRGELGGQAEAGDLEVGNEAADDEAAAMKVDQGRELRFDDEDAQHEGDLERWRGRRVCPCSSRLRVERACVLATIDPDPDSTGARSGRGAGR